MANLAIGAGALLIARKLEDTTEITSQGNHVSRSLESKEYRGKARILLIVYFFSCVTTLAYEILWTRALVLKLGNSTYAFSSILLVYLLGLAAGAMIGSWFIGHRNVRPVHLSVLQWGAAIFTVAGIIFYWSILPMKPVEQLLTQFSTSMVTILSIKIAVPCAVLVIPTAYLGMMFPMILCMINPEQRRISGTTGVVYGISTLGSITGALITVTLLLPNLGLLRSLLTCIILNVSAGTLIVLLMEPKKLK